MLKTLMPFSGLLLAATICLAQKLPNIQAAGLRAPSGIKIDANITDWQNKFQAYNMATGMSYTIANDDENLYFVGQITEPNTLNFKIFQLGVMLIIKKKDNEQVSINYPVKDTKAYLGFRMRYKGQIPDREDELDSIRTARNKVLEKRSKWIVVKGIKGVDTLSVYNGEGFKAIGLFDRQKAYNFEFAIPLKRLNLSVGKADSFKYQVILQGTAPTGDIASPMPNASPAEVAMIAKMNESMKISAANNAAPVDFTAEYTLAKAP